MLEYILSKVPLASSVFLLYALAGAGMLIAGTLDYGSYSTNLLAIGLACGAIGVPRAVSKLGKGIKSTNLLGFIESVPIPSVVFVVFATASSIDLLLTHITFAAFSDNLTKVGVACGVVQAARAIEHVLGPKALQNGEAPAPEPTPVPKPEPPVPTFDEAVGASTPAPSA